MESIYTLVKEITGYAVNKSLMHERDRVYAENRLLSLLRLGGMKDPCASDSDSRHIAFILDDITEYAVIKGITENTFSHKEVFRAEVMNLLMERPYTLERRFYELCSHSPEQATDFLYATCSACNYVQTLRMEKDTRFKYMSGYGALDITINCAKPEKDPKDTTAAKNTGALKGKYPQCAICLQNEGYQGRGEYSARANLRGIYMELAKRPWFFQYSPYSYFPEHCVVLSGKHTPMRLTQKTFEVMLDFVEMLPHYFLGCNADLPMVGGSILEHEHFQGGKYVFPMMKAEPEESFILPTLPGVGCSVLRWPVSVIRLCCKDKGVLTEACSRVLSSWRSYSDPSARIISHTGDVMHNTLNAIMRYAEGEYTAYLVLRNNRADAELPDGIFRQRPHLYNIKKENIGLIEIMGMAILPGRLKRQLKALEKHLISQTPVKAIEEDEDLRVHSSWYSSLLEGGNNGRPWDDILREGAGKRFAEALDCSGVFKQNDNGKKAYKRFIGNL